MKAMTTLPYAYMSLLNAAVEYQQAGDGRALDILAEGQLKKNRCFEHPQDRRAELFNCVAKRIGARVRKRIRTELRQPMTGLFAVTVG